jgi:WD40 repeat protein
MRATTLVFERSGRYILAVGDGGRVCVVALDGSSSRRLEGFSDDTLLYAAAVSPSGRRVAAALGWAEDQSLRVWDLASDRTKRFELPPGTVAGGYERGVATLAFADESTLYSAGDGGLRRWDLDTGAQHVLVASVPGRRIAAQFSSDSRLALLWDWDPARSLTDGRLRIYDTQTHGLRDVSSNAGEAKHAAWAAALDASGSVVAIGTEDGTIRVRRVAEREAHILSGHKGAVDRIAISPDLRWVASTGEDNTLRLWPMPDLSKPPLHTLPLDQLLATLHSLTNLRAVRDPSSANGWKIEVGSFPGWKHTPTW